MTQPAEKMSNVTTFPRAQKTDYPIGSTFGLEGLPPEITTEGRSDVGNPYVPKRKNDHVFRRPLLSTILAWKGEHNGEGLLLQGPTGAGKTSELDQMAARLHIPVRAFNCYKGMEFSDLIGQFVLTESGGMRWQDGPVTAAMRHGDLCVINDAHTLDPSVAVGLYPILEGRPLEIPGNGGELVFPAPGFMLAMTSNNNGYGDSSGFYQSAVLQDIAFLDRFWVMKVDYPEPEYELDILKKAVPNLPGSVLEGMIKVANEVRALFVGTDDEKRNEKAEPIQVTMSTRTLVRWARLTSFFDSVKRQGQSPLRYALDRALTLRAEPAEREAIHQIVQRILES